MGVIRNYGDRRSKSPNKHTIWGENNKRGKILGCNKQNVSVKDMAQHAQDKQGRLL